MTWLWVKNLLNGYVFILCINFKFISTLLCQLSEGAKRGQTDGTNKVHKEFPTILLDDPRHNDIPNPQPVEKCDRGLNHVFTAKFLCPMKDIEEVFGDNNEECVNFIESHETVNHSLQENLQLDQ
jgi:hypothetical protein